MCVNESKMSVCQCVRVHYRHHVDVPNRETKRVSDGVCINVCVYEKDWVCLQECVCDWVCA